MKRIVIDTDAGVDDAQALLLAFGHADSTIEAITTVNGNADVNKTTANVLKILDLVGKDVPVFAGCSHPLVEECHHAAYVHGEDGLGDCGIPISSRQAESKHAVQALVDLANENCGDLELIAIGPLTNLAVALMIDPLLPKKYAGLTIMGGAVKGRGNTNIASEFNIFCDPEAAHIVFSCWPLVRVLTWETTLAHVFDQHTLQRFFSIKTPKAQFFHDTNQLILKFTRNLLKQDILFAPDGLAVAVAIQPDIVLEKETHYLSVELQGKHTRGVTSVDWWDVSQKPANAEIILKIDQDRFNQMMEDGLINP